MMNVGAMFNHVMNQIESLATAHDDYVQAENKIYYMNGNDGTDFDWEANDRTCELMVFFDEKKCGTDLGYIKAFVQTNGDLYYYRYTDYGKKVAEQGVLYKYDEYEAQMFCDYLYEMYDKNNLWDTVVYEM